MSFRFVDWAEFLRESADNLRSLASQRYTPERDRDIILLILSGALIIRKCSEHALINKVYLEEKYDLVFYPRDKEFDKMMESVPEDWRILERFDFHMSRKETRQLKDIIDWLIHDRNIFLYDQENMPEAEEIGEFGIRGIAFASDKSVKRGLHGLTIEEFVGILEHAAAGYRTRRRD